MNKPVGLLNTASYFDPLMGSLTLLGPKACMKT
jgi:hypothetical protein